MATSSLQTIVSDIRIFPYSGLTQTIREQSGIARATVTASVTNTAITATTGSVVRSLNLTASLPQNYSYVMTDGFIVLSADAAADVLSQLPQLGFESQFRGAIIGSDATSRFTMRSESIVKVENDMYWDGGGARLQSQSITGSPPQYHTAFMGDFNGTSDTYERVYIPTSIPKSVFRGSSGPVTLSLDCSNMVQFPLLTGTSITARFNFVQYDIDQAYNYLVNSPNLIR